MTGTPMAGTAGAAVCAGGAKSASSASAECCEKNPRNAPIAASFCGPSGASAARNSPASAMSVIFAALCGVARRTATDCWESATSARRFSGACSAEFPATPAPLRTEASVASAGVAADPRAPSAGGGPGPSPVAEINSMANPTSGAGGAELPIESPRAGAIVAGRSSPGPIAGPLEEVPISAPLPADTNAPGSELIILMPPFT